MLRTLARGLFWAVVLLSLVACGGAEEVTTPIQVAVLAPFSGKLELLGQSARNGVVVAVEEWNQRGGISGRPIELVLGDTRCDAEETEEVTNELVLEGVRFIIGAVCADASLTVANIASRDQVLQISPATTVPELTLGDAGQVRPLVFRACATDMLQGEIAAQFAVDRLQSKTAALVYEQGSLYGSVLADAFEESFVEQEGEVVARIDYDREDQENIAQAFVEVGLLEESPDLLYLPGYHTLASQLVILARLQGITATVMGSDGWHSAQLNTTAVEDAYFFTHYFSGDPRLSVQDWAHKYQERYIAAPDALATLAYDTANILFRAMDTASSIDPATVAEVLETTRFTAVSGPLVFDELHNPIKPLVVLQVLKGQVVYVDRIMP